MPELLIDLSSIDIQKHDQSRKLLSDIDVVIKAKGADPYAVDSISCSYGTSLAWVSGSITLRIDKAGTTLPNINQEFQALVDAYNAALP